MLRLSGSNAASHPVNSNMLEEMLEEMDPSKKELKDGDIPTKYTYFR
jgi:hypothetical protein